MSVVNVAPMHGDALLGMYLKRDAVLHVVVAGVGVVLDLDAAPVGQPPRVERHDNALAAQRGLLVAAPRRAHEHGERAPHGGEEVGRERHGEPSGPPLRDRRERLRLLVLHQRLARHVVVHLHHVLVQVVAERPAERHVRCAHLERRALVAEHEPAPVVARHRRRVQQQAADDRES